LKPVPVLGTVVLLGAVVQLILGFVVAGGMDSLVGVHVLFGLVGLALVIVLAAIAFRAKTATIYSKLAMIILTIVVLAQVGLGVQLLSGAESLALSHEANGFVVVILSLLVGGITFWSAKRKIKV
jgi:heme/copper-type cytochrome/quinol oxidase subunit 4